MKKLFSFAMLFAALSFALVSCKEEDKPATGGETGGTTGGTTEVTIDEANYAGDLYIKLPMSNMEDDMKEIVMAMENVGWTDEGFNQGAYIFSLEPDFKTHVFNNAFYVPTDGGWIQPVLGLEKGTLTENPEEAAGMLQEILQSYGVAQPQDFKNQMQDPSKYAAAYGGVDSRNVFFLFYVGVEQGASGSEIDVIRGEIYEYKN